MCNLHTHSPTMFHVRSRDLLFAQKYISEGRFCFDEKLSGCSSQRCYFLVLKHQSKHWHIYCQGSMFVQAIRVPWLYGNYISILKNVMAHKKLWQWLVEHTIFKNKLDEDPVRILFNLYNKNTSRSGNQKPDSNCHSEEIVFPSGRGTMLIHGIGAP